MKQFFFRSRYNRVDAVTQAVWVLLMFSGNYGVALIAVLVGAVVSVAGESTL